MDEPEEGNLDDSSTVGKSDKTLSAPKKGEADEETVSDGSISEHITSSNGSIENDRSLQEIEFHNQTSAFDKVTTSEHESDTNLFNSLSNNSNGFIDNMGIEPQTENNSESKKSKSLLEELLVNSQLQPESEISKEESFNVFANVDFSDKSLLNVRSLNENKLELEIPEDKLDQDDRNNVDLKVRQLEEIVAVKEFTINALTQELDSFRELSNPTYTLSMVSATEYKQLQDEHHNKILEYNSAIIYKNDVIQQLSESLEQSVNERKELLSQIDIFKEEIAQLQIKLEETSKMVKEHQCDNLKSINSIREIDQQDKPLIDREEESLNNEGNDIVIKLQNEISNLTEKMRHDKETHENEIIKLRELLNHDKCGSAEIMDLKIELERKHAKEVEELRTYFERKCVELEKNYSEEIFSQQSRKMSDSSSDVELSNDLLLSNQPGPGGDHNKVIKSKEDVEKFKENLTNFLNKMTKYSLEDLTDKELRKIELDVKNELNILLKIGEKLEIRAIENRYIEEISNLKFQLEETRKEHGHISISSVIQEVGSSGEFEINEVIESYERRLQEQVNLAKIDIINELVEQIQRLVSNAADEEEWPSELLQLRDKFVDKYENQIKDLKYEHEQEIIKLKEEHLKMLNGALERARRRSLKDDDSLSKSDTELAKERDNLKKQVISLRNLLSQLLRYFTQAEDALNNTLVDELLRQSVDKNSTHIEEDLNLDNSVATTNSSKILDSFTHVTRVHIAPNFEELINMIEQQSQRDDTPTDISVDVKNELDSCLDKLNQEANAILALTLSLPKVQSQTTSPKGPADDKVNYPSKSLFLETQQKEKSKLELIDSNEMISSLMKQKDVLEARVDELLEKISVMESELDQAKYKIAELIENGRKEIVSEGYGENGDPPLPELDDAMAMLSTLQEKARTMLAQSRASADPNLLQLIEELCRAAEKIREEAKKEKTDMMQQAEQLERQLHDITKQFHDEHHKFKELEEEREEAHEKIRILRDIIRDLEQQNDEKDQKITEHLRNVEKLECIVEEQHRSIEELKSLNVAGDVSDIQGLRRHIEELEQEVQQLRIGAELAGSEGAVKQIRLQLFELEVSLDKKTRDLELLHSTGANSCSSPSEDMSVRDVVRPHTPNSSAMDECEVPLQQLARLKEKLVKHSRAEEAALKRIRDLEMQVFNMKSEIDEAQNEKEYMKRQIQEQLVLISDLQIRLDHQRIKAEHIEKQTNTSLESKIYDLQNEILTLQEKLTVKNKAINHQEQVIKETQERVKDLENDIVAIKDDDLVIEMQKELENLRQENHQMKDRLSTENQILPNLVENIISDKNADIEKLRNRLNDTEQCLNSYTSLNLDKHDLKLLANLKNTGGSIEHLISILDLSQPLEHVRRMETSRNANMSALNHISFKKSANETEFLGSSSEPEISSIERIGQPNLQYTMATPEGKPNSTEIGHKSTEKKVHFDISSESDDLNMKIGQLQREISEKDKIIVEYETKIKIVNKLEENITKLQQRLDETEQALNNATRTFEKEQEEAKEREKQLGVALAEKKVKLSQSQKEIQVLKEDSVRKDELFLNLTREKKTIQEELGNLKKESMDSLNDILNKKNSVIDQLQAEKDTLLKTVNNMERELQESISKIDYLVKQINDLQTIKQQFEEKETFMSEEKFKLKKELDNKCVSLENALLEAKNWKGANAHKESELIKLTETLNIKDEAIKKLEEAIVKKHALVLDKDCDIEIMGEDMKYYQTQLTDLEDKLKSLENPMIKKKHEDEKLKISELTKEVAHFQDLVREKDRIIAQMTEDHSLVHSNLKAIDNKIKETGNIFDLSGRLKKEQQKNAELLEEIHGLKARLLNYEVADSAPVEEITSQLKRELECAAQMDSNIINAVSDQSLSSLSETQDIETYKKAAIRQKSQNRQILRAKDKLEKDKVSLEKTCHVLQQRLNELQNILERERILTKQTQLEDAKLMEQLRIQLDGVLDFKEQIEKVLEEERHCRRALEIQIEELKKTGNSSSESTKYKPLPSAESIELNHVRKELESVKEEKAGLISALKSLKQENSQLENNIKYTKEMLVLQEERNRAQDEKIRVFGEKDKVLTDELIKKNFELEIKGREVEEKKIKMDELTQEKDLLKRQKSDLMKALKSQTSMIPSLETGIPDALESAIRELKEKNEENKRRLEYIEKIETEKRHLENQLRSEMANNMKNNVPFSDLVARCDYLFSKALKLESVKKSLIWQKRYLTDYLQSHQKHCLITILPNQPHENYYLRHRHTPLEHFRSAVYAVIAVERMKFLVKRWHSGIRKSEKINARHYERSKQKFLLENPGSTANFQVGQPVSSQHFSYKPSRLNNPFNQDLIMTTDDSRPASPASVMSTIRDTPWSGNTPPSKDNRPQNALRIGSSVLNRDDITPLRAPQLLTQFQERFEQIQEKLGVPFSEDRTLVH